MPRVAHNQTNFTAGELSPQTRGRVDIDKYPNGVAKMENAFPTMYGGAKKHFGSLLSKPAKFNTSKVRLIPFIFSRSQAYIIEVGDSYMRFFNADGQIISGGLPVEIATPYSESEIRAIEYAQGADTMFLAHEDNSMQRLQRLSSSSWTIDNVPFSVTPFDEIGFYPAASLTMAGGTATASAATFLKSDIGRDIIAGAGRLTITGFTSTTVVTGTIQSPFPPSPIASTGWKIDGSPQIAVSPSQKSPEGLTVSITAHGDPVIVTLYSLASNVLTVTTSTAHGLIIGSKAVFVGFESLGLNGTYTVASVPTTTTFTIAYTQSVLDGGALGVIYKFGVGEAWRATDVGSFIKINGGMIKITGFVSTTEVRGLIVDEMTSTIAAPPNGWSLEAAVWNPVDGYPRAVSIHQQRLIAAGSPGFPRTIWGSMSGLYLDFTRGTDDDSSFSFILSSTESNDQISHLASLKKLIVLTEGGEFSGTGASNGPITPTSVQFDPESGYGSNDVRPVRVGSKLLFIQGEGRRVRSFDYALEKDSYDAADLSLLSEHLTESGIVDMAYCKEPYSLVFAVRADGVLVTLTYNPTEGVIGWAQRPTDGDYESVACIPAGGVDQVWVSVRRTINGVDRRFIERLDPNIGVDCGVQGFNAAGANVWGGLSHLEGKTVDVIGDGLFAGQFPVSNGFVTIPYPAKNVTIGLPFRPNIELLPPEIATPTGSSSISAMNTSEVTIKFLETASCTVNGQEIVSRRFNAELLDQPVPLMTGNHRIENLAAWNRGDSPVVISQDDPLPFYMLAIIRRITVND